MVHSRRRPAVVVLSCAVVMLGLVAPSVDAPSPVAAAVDPSTSLPVAAAIETPTVDTPVTIMGAGDIGGSNLADSGSTGDLIRAANPSAVFTLGDNAYSNGTAADYAARYEPSWGSFRDKTHPVPGNHEYNLGPADGYVGYFGASAVANPVDGGLYYAWDVGNGWRAYALNTEIDVLGAQLTWLQNDLAANPGLHYILQTHHARYTSGGNHSGSARICPLWNAIAATGGLELVLTGHEHSYERFAKMDCAGNRTDTGARSFVVGSGGNRLYPAGTVQPGSEFFNNTDFGVLELVLRDTSYEWAFVASGRGYDGASSVATGNTGARLDIGSEPTHRAASPGNLAPTVNAGVDVVTSQSSSAVLDGTVADDGLPAPPGAVTTTWSKVSGPGIVTFTDAAATDTTASFSASGDYVLRLAASDSAFTSSDTVGVTVQPAAGSDLQTVQVRVAAGANDAEQVVGGSTTLGSSDLELVADGAIQQVVGIRFPGVQIPVGAAVTRAYVQFQTDEASTVATTLTIRLEDHPNPAAYTTGTGTVTARAVTGNVAWAPPGWPTVGAAGLDQRTPDLSGLVRAAVNRAGWAPGNALALQFSGTGRRTAEAFEGSAAGAPLLHVEYTTSGTAPPNWAPTVSAGQDLTVTLPATASLDGTVGDDGLPAPPAAVTTTWSRVSGPGTVMFGNAMAVDTTATFSAAGTYVLQLTGDDSALSSSDTVTVTVQPAVTGGGGTRTVDVRVAVGSDDAEQRVGRSTALSSSDLELIADGSVQQVVAMRFPGVQIPVGATVTRAYVQFQTDEVSTAAASLTIRAETSVNPPTYTSGTGTLTARAVSSTSVSWAPAAWPTVGAAEPDQRTPDLAALVQAAVDRPGWAPGNALAFQFSGSGRRTAEAFEGSATGAPLLHVEYLPAG